MLRRAVVVALLALPPVAAAPVPSPAQTPVLDRIVRSGEIRVALSGTQPPYNALNKRGVLMGLDVDLAGRIADALGVEVRFVTRPFPLLLDTLASDEADIVMSGLTITPERNREFAFAGPYALSGRALLTRKRELAEVRDPSEINVSGLRLVTLEDSTSQLYAERRLSRATVTTVASYDAAILKVLDDEADAMVADQQACAMAVLRFPGEGLEASPEPLTVEPIGIALQPDLLLLNLLENFLSALETAGVLGELREKWLEDGSWVAALP
jgi:polar amino acid transport system substrate-binding protein